MANRNFNWDSPNVRSRRNRDHFSEPPSDRNFEDGGYAGLNLTNYQPDQNRRSFVGVGPKGYKRSDQKIFEDVCEVLTIHPRIDPTEIEVKVKDGVVSLWGTVSSRDTKRMAEDVILDCRGVIDVNNRLIVGTNFQNEGRLASRWQSQEKINKNLAARKKKTH